MSIVQKENLEESSVIDLSQEEINQVSGAGDDDVAHNADADQAKSIFGSTIGDALAP